MYIYKKTIHRFCILRRKRYVIAFIRMNWLENQKNEMKIFFLFIVS